MSEIMFSYTCCSHLTSILALHREALDASDVITDQATERPITRRVDCDNKFVIATLGSKDVTGNSRASDGRAGVEVHPALTCIEGTNIEIAARAIVIRI